jgi:hypothetical protein
MTDDAKLIEALEDDLQTWSYPHARKLMSQAAARLRALTQDAPAQVEPFDPDFWPDKPIAWYEEKTRREAAAEAAPTPSLLSDLAGLVESWRSISKADPGPYDQANAGGDAYETCADELSALISRHSAGKAQEVTGDLSQAVRDVLSERQRQIAKGWTPEHDDEHANGEIIWAPDWGAVYRVWRSQHAKIEEKRNLLKESAAQIIAEIERLDRAATKEPSDV